jgi:hypothetical protein
MRALVIFLFVLGAVAFMASCGSETTEVAWTNANATNPIKDIQWNINEVVWSGEIASGSTTDSKEVTTTTGNVECLVDADAGGPGGFAEATTVKVGDNIVNTAITLNEGESQTLSLTAN